MTLKTYAIIAVAALSAFFAGKYLFPKTVAETVVKEKVVTVEKIVERKNVVTKTKYVKAPDGTETTETTTSDQSITYEDKTVATSKETSKKAAAKMSLGALAITDFSGSKPEYGITAAVPLFGAVKVQALGTTDRRLGLGLAVEF